MLTSINENICLFSIFVGVPLPALFDLSNYVVCNGVVRNNPPKVVEDVQIFRRIFAKFGHFRSKFCAEFGFFICAENYVVS